ncbi:TIM23 complex component, partial [Quaeritorhiza haematococci]
HILEALDARDAEFFDRIARNRPQDIRTNLQNPLPDYYGEKIKSVKDYREWLKKQREWKIKTGFR